MPINNYCPEDYLNEGNKLFNLERYHEAITYYKYAKNLEPTNSLSYFYIALSNYKLDHPKLAMDYINNNLYLGEDPVFYALKGILLMELGRPQEAFDYF